MSPSLRLQTYPMGPHTRAYLGISDTEYLGDRRQEPVSQTESAAFEDHLIVFSAQAKRLNANELVDLLDELVTMNLPRAALTIASGYPEDSIREDFRARLALGVAGMLCADLSVAEDHLKAAQALIPEEPAPYVNLVQIYLDEQRLDTAETWCLAGLDAEVNHHALWELLAEIMRLRHGDYLPDVLLAMAEKRCSWAGMSLAANLMATGDRYLKANLLEKLYAQGERDPQFLVELTAAYGIAGDFAKIPPIVWQAEKHASKGLPWQLRIHLAQAQLALGQSAEALATISKTETDQTLPEEALAVLGELAEEARQPAELH